MTQLHPRHVIRHAVADRLTGKTAAGARVYRSRVVPLRRSELPGIGVYVQEENTDATVKSSPPELTRSAQLVVDAFVEGGDNVDDVLDALALQIETAMDADPTLGASASDCVLTSYEAELIESGERLIGQLRHVYTVTYYTLAFSEPELDDFNTADVHHNPGGALALEDQAHDRVDLEE